MIIGITADDLTGAADSVAPFAARGLRADVQWVSGGKFPRDLDAADARSWCAGTRDMPVDREFAIRRITRAVTRRLQRFAPLILYKKIDSTLRGHLRMELDAMRTELSGRLAIVCPAFPANGRIVREGVLYCHGEARQNVRSAFGMGDDGQSVELPLDTLRSQSGRLADRLMHQLVGGVHTVFCDAESAGDLDVIARAVVEMEDKCLPVGSAGLSAAIAARVPGGDPDRALDALRDDLSRGPVVVVVGSLHAAARRQAARLTELARIAPIVTPEPEDLTTLTSAGARRLRAVPEEIARRFEAGDRVVLVKTPDSDHLALGSARGADAYYRLMRLAAIPTGFGLVVTGGHTAQLLIQSLDNWDGITILGEMAPGVVAGRIRGSEEYGSVMDGRPIVLKSGGFGDDDTLARCAGLGNLPHGFPY